MRQQLQADIAELSSKDLYKLEYIEVLPSELIDYLSQFDDSDKVTLDDIESFFQEVTDRNSEQQRTDGEWT